MTSAEGSPSPRRRAILLASVGGAAGAGWLAGDVFTDLDPEQPEVDVNSTWLDVRADGAQGNGSSDDSLALARTLRRANETVRRNPVGVGVVVHLPTGRFKIEGGTLPALAAGVKVVGDGREATRIVVPEARPVFRWLGEEQPPNAAGGGIHGLTIACAAPGEGNEPIIEARNSNRLSFTNLRVEGAPCIIRLGGDVGVHETIISDLQGVVPNRPGAAIDLIHGSVATLSNITLSTDVPSYPQTREQGHPVLAGVDAIRLGQGGWDTLRLRDVLTNRFDRGLVCEVTGRSPVANVFIEGAVFDYCKTSAVHVVARVGAVTKFYFQGCYFVSTHGPTSYFSGEGGDVLEISFSSCTTILSGTNAWRFENRVQDVILTSCMSSGTNRTGSTDGDSQDALVFNCSGWQVIGGTHGADGYRYNGYSNRARFAFSALPESDRYIISGVRVQAARGMGRALLEHPKPSRRRRLAGNLDETDDGAPLVPLTSMGSGTFANTTGHTVLVSLPTATSARVDRNIRQPGLLVVPPGSLLELVPAPAQVTGEPIG